MPEKSKGRYSPKVFGFKVHASAALERWQDERRLEMVRRLKALGVNAAFPGDVDDAVVDDEMDEDDEGGYEGVGAE